MAKKMYFFSSFLCACFSLRTIESTFLVWFQEAFNQNYSTYSYMHTLSFLPLWWNRERVNSCSFLLVLLLLFYMHLSPLPAFIILRSNEHFVEIAAWLICLDSLLFSICSILFYHHHHQSAAVTTTVMATEFVIIFSRLLALIDASYHLMRVKNKKNASSETILCDWTLVLINNYHAQDLYLIFIIFYIIYNKWNSSHGKKKCK